MSDGLDALFALTGGSFTSVEGAITVRGVAPLTVFFAEREAGHLATARFVELWKGGFEPRVVVSFLDGAPDAVVVVREASVDGDVLEGTVELVEGVLPAEAGPCVLFVDALDQPLEPVLAPPARKRRR
jgi:hypothetical protein